MEKSTGVINCPLCTHSIRSHPRCALCSLFFGYGHVEIRGLSIGTKLVCHDHEITSNSNLMIALKKDIQIRREYDLSPQMDIETEQLPRYPLTAIPEWLITPKQAADTTGWNPHTVRVRIGKNKIDQQAWAISGAGWKAGLYDKERVLLILERIEDNPDTLLDTLAESEDSQSEDSQTARLEGYE